MTPQLVISVADLRRYSGRRYKLRLDGPFGPVYSLSAKDDGDAFVESLKRASGRDLAILRIKFSCAAEGAPKEVSCYNTQGDE